MNKNEIFQDIKSGHWSDGGTGITNFSSDVYTMIEAIIKYGDPDLKISRSPMSGYPSCLGCCYSLHDLKKGGTFTRRNGLTDFWGLRDKIKTGGKDMYKSFWMVYVDGQNAPVIKHETEQSALTEARRLAKITGNETFVLKAVIGLEKVMINTVRLA